MMLGEFSSDISTLTSQMGTQIFLAAISLYKSMFSHSPKWVFSLRPQTPTPPLLILPLRIWLHLILDWGKQKQSNRTIFLFAISSLLRLPAAVFILSAFVLLPRVECPCSYLKLTNFPLVLGSPSLAFSRMLLLQFPRSLLHHGCLALFWIIPTCIQTISGASWPYIPPQLLLPFFPALTHSTHSWVVYRHPVHFTFPSCRNRALPSPFSFDLYVAKFNG